MLITAARTQFFKFSFIYVLPFVLEGARSWPFEQRARKGLALLS
jgi:hypothetical protein